MTDYWNYTTQELAKELLSGNTDSALLYECAERLYELVDLVNELEAKLAALED